MRPSQRELIEAGLLRGAAYGALTFLICLTKFADLDWRLPLFLFIAHGLLGLPALLFGRDRQLRWYRSAFFVPVTSIWGAVLAAILGEAFSLPFLVALLGFWIVLPGAPVVWLIGAVWIWQRDRRLASTPCPGVS